MEKTDKAVDAVETKSVGTVMSVDDYAAREGKVVNMATTLSPPDVPKLSSKEAGIFLISEFEKIISNANETLKKTNPSVEIDFSWQEVNTRGIRRLVGHVHVKRQGHLIPLINFDEVVKPETALKGTQYYGFIFKLIYELSLIGLTTLEREVNHNKIIAKIDSDLKAMDEDGLKEYITFIYNLKKEPTPSFEGKTKRDLFEDALKLKSNILNG